MKELKTLTVKLTLDVEEFELLLKDYERIESTIGFHVTLDDVIGAYVISVLADKKEGKK